MCADWRLALEELVGLGVTRVLTSGQARSAPEGAQTIAEMVRVADGRLTVLPGGGIAEHNVTGLVQATGVSEVHLTGTTTRVSAMTFRTPTVEMGNAPPRSEYEWPQTDATVIERVVTALNP